MLPYGKMKVTWQISAHETQRCGYAEHSAIPMSFLRGWSTQSASHLKDN
uniref:Uncharacterized protein n=1 Tax=Anguilla anguilla TaxID=7936 RepID=A0A0E9SRX7_ANGAN